MSETVPAPIRRRIVVHKTSGKDGNDFFKCFFLENDAGLFNFHNQQGGLLHKDVHTGEEFHVEINGTRFLVFRFHIDQTAAHGHFIPLNPETGEAQVGVGADPEGSFQASSGPGEGYGEDVSAEPPPGAIVIKGVLGTSDSDKLKGMYFLPAPNQPGPVQTYNLYNKKGKWIESGIQSGIVFTFQHDSFMLGGGGSQKIVWTITDFVITSTAASGKWTNTDPSITGEQGGSFQASSGPGADPEAEAAAGASA